MKQIIRIIIILIAVFNSTAFDAFSADFCEKRTALYNRWSWSPARAITESSNYLFYGDGDIISQEGKKLLDQLAKFLLAAPTRIVISENGPGNDRNAGLQRAWTVLEYLDSKEGLRRELFSVTASTTVLGKRPKHRMLEITLLERDVFE